jgi:hypothetical protein
MNEQRRRRLSVREEFAILARQEPIGEVPEEPREEIEQPSESMAPITDWRKKPRGERKPSIGVVVSTGVSCPKCECTESLVLNTPIQRKLNVWYQEKKYNHVTWRRRQCSQCRQVFMEREFRNMPIE